MDRRRAQLAPTLRRWNSHRLRNACFPRSARFFSRSAFLATTVVSLSVGTIGGGQEKEPLARLIAKLSDENAEVRRTAASSIGQMGSAAHLATGELVQTLGDPDAGVRTSAVTALWKIGPLPLLDNLSILLDHSTSDVRSLAALTAAMIGPDARKLVPHLIERLMDTDEQVRAHSALALANIGPTASSAIASLLATLDDDYWQARQYAALALGRVTLVATDPKFAAAPDGGWRLAWGSDESYIEIPDALSQLTKTLHVNKMFGGVHHLKPAFILNALGRAAVPALVRALDDPHARVRRTAASSLGRIGSPAAEAVPALEARLRDEDRFVRAASAGALASLGSSAGTAVPALIQALQDEEKQVRWGAAEALGRLGPSAEAAVPALIETLHDQDRFARESAATALGMIGEKAQHAVPALIDAAADLGVAAIEGLAGIGPKAVPAIPTLLEALRSSHPTAPIFASRGLAKIPEAEPHLLQILADPDATVRLWAVRTLAEMRRKSRKTEQALFEVALHDPDEKVRGEVLFAISKSQLDSKTSVSVFVRALKNSDGVVRERAAVALGRIGSQIPVAPLLDALGDRKETVRLEVVRTLLDRSFRTDPDDPESKLIFEALLLTASEDSNDAVREKARLALRDSYAGRKLLIDTLLGDPDARARARAACILEKIELESQEAVAALTKALADPSMEVRQCAEKALNKQ